MTRAYVGIGSNVGDRLAHLQSAVDGLHATPGVTVVSVSPVYETDPVGPDQPDFLNGVVAVETSLGAHALLEVGLALEDAAGRTRVEHWGPRTLDCDVLLFGDETHDDPALTVPHPHMWERAFVLIPLRAVAPELVPAAAIPAPSGVRTTELALRLPR